MDFDSVGDLASGVWLHNVPEGRRSQRQKDILETAQRLQKLVDEYLSPTRE